jgi:hypothetical protein
MWFAEVLIKKVSNTKLNARKKEVNIRLCAAVILFAVTNRCIAIKKSSKHKAVLISQFKNLTLRGK